MLYNYYLDVVGYESDLGFENRMINLKSYIFMEE